MSCRCFSLPATDGHCPFHSAIFFQALATKPEFFRRAPESMHPPFLNLLTPTANPMVLSDDPPKAFFPSQITKNKNKNVCTFSDTATWNAHLTLPKSEIVQWQYEQQVGEVYSNLRPQTRARIKTFEALFIDSLSDLMTSEMFLTHLWLNVVVRLNQNGHI